MNTACSSSSLNLPLFYMVQVAGDKGKCVKSKRTRGDALCWLYTPVLQAA